MTRIGPVRTKADHERALRRIAEIFDASSGTEEADELDVLATLVSAYEKVSVPLPSPVAAIRFRMAQEGLAPRDLEPFIGSRARVSEILSGERTLTIEMMRALRKHLGIPADALLGASPPAAGSQAVPSRLALAKLAETGLLKAGETFTSFLSRGFGTVHRPAMLRRTRTDRTNAKTDAAALQGWCAAALIGSRRLGVSKKTARVKYDAAMGRELAQLSADPVGLLRVSEYLAHRGVCLVILPHLPGTFLDGAAMLREDGVPVVALTVRHDRIDNFWFTLLHEFAHVACHLGDETSMIVDDLDIRSCEAVEAQADVFAQRALVPDRFAVALASPTFDLADVERLARQAGVHEAVIAGRWQREHKDYRRFSKLVGHGEVRRHFLGA